MYNLLNKGNFFQCIHNYEGFYMKDDDDSIGYKLRFFPP